MAECCFFSDGNTLLAVSQFHIMYVSTNAGATWISNSVTDRIWSAAASSADGNMLVAAAIYTGTPPNTSPGAVYTSYSTPAPRLNLTPSSNNLALSWLVPSTNFVLQQNLNLNAGSWVTQTNIPVLNFTNLQNQVILSPSDSSGFFRLMAQ